MPEIIFVQFNSHSHDTHARLLSPIWVLCIMPFSRPYSAKISHDGENPGVQEEAVRSMWFRNIVLDVKFLISKIEIQP